MDKQSYVNAIIPMQHEYPITSFAYPLQRYQPCKSIIPNNREHIVYRSSAGFSPCRVIKSSGSTLLVGSVLGLTACVATVSTAGVGSALLLGALLLAGAGMYGLGACSGAMVNELYHCW